MVKCEFCKNKYEDKNLEFCPGCGAKLKKVPDFRRPATANRVPSEVDTSKKGGAIFWSVIGVLVLTGIASKFSGSSTSDKKQLEEVQNVGNYGTALTESDESEEESLFKYETMPQIAEHIWPGTELTPDLFSQITYFSFYITEDTLDVSYGFGDPFDENPEIEYFSISDATFSNTEIELELFTGLQKLESNLWLTFSEIETLASLKYLDVLYTEEDLSQLGNLNMLECLILESSSLNSLQGIQEFHSLKELSLKRAEVKDLTPLSQCDELTTLSLIDCDDIQSFNAIGDLASLISLSIMDTDALDLSFIGKLKRIKNLTISDSETKSLDFLGDLPDLEYLSLDDISNVKDLPSFERSAGSLKELELDASKLDSLDILNPLVNLEKLTIYNPSSVKPLSNMKKLQELTLSPGHGMDTLEPLGSLTALRKLTFIKNMGFTPWDNSVFSFLTKLVDLEELSFADCELYFNADPVYTLTNLKVLDCSGNTVCGDFSKIKNLKNLKSLRLANTNLADSFRFESDGFVTSISIDGESTMDSQTPNIAALSGLCELDVSDTDLHDITFLKDLKNLECFYASDNYISDAFVLSELPSLRIVDLSANAIANWEELDSLKNVQIIGKP